MTTYIKTITFGPTSGGRKVASDRVDPIVNGIPEKIQNEGGNILDIKIALAPLKPGNYVSEYLIIYEASQASTQRVGGEKEP